MSVALRRKYSRFLDQFTAPSQNGTSTASFNGGKTIYKTRPKFTKAGGVPATKAEIIAQVQSIELRQGSKVIVNSLPPAVLISILEHWSEPSSDNGIIDINHTLPYLESRSERDLMAMGTADGGKITAKIRWNNVSLTITNVELRAEVTNEFRPAGGLLVYDVNSDQSSTASYQISDLPRGKITGKADQAYICHILDTDDVDEVNLRVNETDILDNSTREEILHVNASAGRADVTGSTLIDFSLDNTIDARLAMVGINELVYDITFGSAPSAFNVYSIRMDNMQKVN